MAETQKILTIRTPDDTGARSVNSYGHSVLPVRQRTDLSPVDPGRMKALFGAAVDLVDWTNSYRQKIDDEMDNLGRISITGKMALANQKAEESLAKVPLSQAESCIPQIVGDYRRSMEDVMTATPLSRRGRERAAASLNAACDELTAKLNYTNTRNQVKYIGQGYYQNFIESIAAGSQERAGEFYDKCVEFGVNPGMTREEALSRAGAAKITLAMGKMNASKLKNCCDRLDDDYSGTGETFNFELEQGKPITVRKTEIASLRANARKLYGIQEQNEFEAEQKYVLKNGCRSVKEYQQMGDDGLLSQNAVQQFARARRQECVNEIAENITGAELAAKNGNEAEAKTLLQVARGLIEQRHLSGDLDKNQYDALKNSVKSGNLTVIAGQKRAERDAQNHLVQQYEYAAMVSGDVETSRNLMRQDKRLSADSRIKLNNTLAKMESEDVNGERLSSNPDYQQAMKDINKLCSAGELRNTNWDWFYLRVPGEVKDNREADNLANKVALIKMTRNYFRTAKDATYEGWKSASDEAVKKVQDDDIRSLYLADTEFTRQYAPKSAPKPVQKKPGEKKEEKPVIYDEPGGARSSKDIYAGNIVGYTTDGKAFWTNDGVKHSREKYQ